MTGLAWTLRWTLVAFVVAGLAPLLVGVYEFLLIGLQRVRHHLNEARPVSPRVAIVVPAWNEGAVVGRTIDTLLAMSYPAEAIRVYVVDDASTDDTPAILAAKAEQYPGQVHHLRREKGGEGKAHTLNHGLRIILADSWAEAVLIIDADVIFTKTALRRMARHLADPEVGAVTAYIKEGSRPGNYMTRFIGFEYITAQAAARRAQNVLGAQACLAGGAQLLSRENLEAIGGQIDTSSLAEDTFTTFKTQIGGKKVAYEGNAIVWAEEPNGVDGLWKQRLRWARGNVQVTTRFKHLWFNRGAGGGKLGGITFGLIWFTVFLMPVFMILASVGLVGLYFIDFPLSWQLFRTLWIANAISYVFILVFSLLIDTETGRRTWFQGAMFPGIVALVIILYTCFPPLFETYLRGGLEAVGITFTGTAVHVTILFVYVWLSASMLAARAVLAVERTALLRPLARPLLYVVGYGPLLCAITFTAYVKEARGAEMRWDKTEKTGQVGQLA